MSESVQMPWWRGAVIYQIYPRSFHDSNGDGVGDLTGIVQRLDHIASLGVDAIWISPFFKSPMRDFGYDISDYRSVDPIFGTNEDFDRLVAEAHERGLKVVIDMVLAHCSDEHAWFEESRQSRDNAKADWYVWAGAKPDGSPPNNWQSVFGGASWHWDSRRSQYYLHHFLKSQPNLNWRNPEVVDAMLGEAEFWLERGVDGLRLDAITTLVHDGLLRDNPPVVDDGKVNFGGTHKSPFAHQTHLYDRDQPEIMECFARLRALTDRFPDRFMLGEIADVDSIEATARYTQGNRALHSGYTFELTQQAYGWDHFHEVIGRFEELIGDGWPTYAFGNHDCVRTVSRWGAEGATKDDQAALAKMLMACLLSLRGSVCIYQGEELGLTDADLDFADLRDPWGIEFYPAHKGRDGCRTPMPWVADAANAGFGDGKPWLPVPDEHRLSAADRQSDDPESVLNAYRRFLAWRREHRAMIVGDFVMAETEAPVFAFERQLEDQRIFCAFNLSNRPATVSLAGDWRPMTGPGPTAGLDDGQVSLPPFGAFFAEAGS